MRIYNEPQANVPNAAMQTHTSRNFGVQKIVQHVARLSETLSLSIQSHPAEVLVTKSGSWETEAYHAFHVLARQAFSPQRFKNCDFLGFWPPFNQDINLTDGSALIIASDEPTV